MDPALQNQAQRERRIHERRRRIQERLQALREGEKAGPQSAAEVQYVGPGKQQTFESVRRVMALRSDTSAAVDSVQLQADAAENARRIAEEARKQELRTKMLTEAEQSARKNAAVAMYWADLFTIDVPQELWDEIQVQKQACDAIIKSKNELILDIKKDLKAKDNDFARLLKQQMEDIALLMETMTKQIRNMHSACASELQSIETAYMEERKAHLTQNESEIVALFEKRLSLENSFMEQYLELVSCCQKELFELQVNDAQDFNSLRVRLENDRQSLEQHMEVMLATYQLNIEKLDYNYRVLVERDHENNVTINQQKRKIARQRDLLQNLKQRYRDSDQKFHEENLKLTSEYKRITEQFKDLQLKFKHFELVDSKKYSDIWAMKEAHVIQLVEKVMAADKVIHEQQLGWEWKPPRADVLWSPYSPEAAEAEKAKQQEGGGGAEDSEADDAAVARAAGLEEVRRYRDDPRFARAMAVVTDEAGFLLEPKVREMIAALPAETAGKTRVEALLEVLGVTDGAGFEALVAALDPSSDVELRAKGMGTGAAERPEIANPPVLVTEDEIVKRLRAFIEAESASIQGGGGGAKSKAVGPRLGVSRRVMEREREFWRKVSRVVDARGMRVWNALERNLHKYHQLLVEREKGLRSVEALGQQNIELRALLNQYLSSQINSELQIPPTQLI